MNEAGSIESKCLPMDEAGSIESKGVRGYCGHRGKCGIWEWDYVRHDLRDKT